LSARRFAALAIVAPLLVLGALALAASRDAGNVAFDAPVGDVLVALAPVSSDDVHIDPVLEIATLIVSGLTALVLLGLLARRQLRAALFVAAAIGAAVLLSRVLKELVQRPAIEGPADAYSFPSGSATWCAATLVALWLVAAAHERRWLALGGAVFVLGYSGIIVWEEWHHATDVVAGWCLAVVCGASLWVLLGRPRADMLTRRARREPRTVAYPSS
jgi:membrane-associated phospholipid phosphatase